MNPDVYSGPPRRLTPEEWAAKAFGERASAALLVLAAHKADRVTREADLRAAERWLDAIEERRAQGGRG